MCIGAAFSGVQNTLDCVPNATSQCPLPIMVIQKLPGSQGKLRGKFLSRQGTLWCKCFQVGRSNPLLQRRRWKTEERKGERENELFSIDIVCPSYSFTANSFGNFYRVLILSASIQVFPFASLHVIRNLHRSHLSNRIHQVMSEILQL